MKAFCFAALVLVAAAIPALAAGTSDEKSLANAARLNAQLAVAYLKQGEVAVAQEKINKALAQNPHDAGVQLSAALVYERLQQPDIAESYYAGALKLDPKNPDMQNNFAVFECRNGRYAQGQKLFEQAARNAAYGTPEVAYANAGVCARSANNNARAEEYFRKAIAIRPDYPDALLQLADLNFQRGEGLAARGLLERYFQVTPVTPDALELAVRIEQKLGDRETRTRYEQQLQHDFPDSVQARRLRSGAGGE